MSAAATLSGQDDGRDPSASEQARFHEEGYLVIRDFFNPVSMAEMLRWTADLEREPEQPGRHWVYHEDSVTMPKCRVIQRIENFCPFHREFDELIRTGALVRWVGALMNGPVVLFKDKINFKMPGGPGFKAHQDQQAGWGVYAPRFVTAMVTLDHATVENGCLEMVGGRHTDGLLGAEWRPLSDKNLIFHAVPTSPGDVIFFDSYTPHASKDNLTELPRRILYLTYNLKIDGDNRLRYFADKHISFPPDIERDKSRQYVFRV